MRRDVSRLRTSSGFLLLVVISLLLLLVTVDGKAADPSAGYPSRPIDLVVHQGPGSSSDMFGRIISDIIQKEKILSKPMFVVNKPGGGGAVASGFVFEKKGNPHVVLVVSSTFITTPLLEKLPYTATSFTPIANLVVDGSVLVVRSDSPFKTADDLIAEARRRPKELIQAGGSLNGFESMMGRSIQKVKGVQWNIISFNSGSEAILNVLSGNVHFAFGSPIEVWDHVRAGKLRVLLAGAPNRYPQFKDIPTVKEAGMGVPFASYRGLVGPPNMPDYAVKKLEGVFKKVSESERFRKYVAELAMQSFWLSLNEYGKWLGEESNRIKLQLAEINLLKK